ncbi:MAG: hypothetical protein RSJ41_07340 [Clostridia bacterium]
MKRWVMVFLCGALLMWGGAGAEGVYRADGFGFAYPDAWVIDSSTYAQDNTGAYQWIADVYADAMAVVVAREAIPGLEGFTLMGARDEDAQGYKQAIMDDLNGTFLESVDNQAGTARFLLFEMADAWGKMLGAFTVDQGVEISFCLMPESGDWTREGEAALRGMLDSFVLGDEADAPDAEDAEDAPDAPDAPDAEDAPDATII